MVKMPAEVQETINKQSPVPIATADADGNPNVVFVGFLRVVDDETIHIADNFFDKTVTNLYIIEVRVCGGDCYGKDASRSAGDNK